MKRRSLFTLGVGMLATLLVAGVAQATPVGTSGGSMEGPGLSVAIAGVGLEDLGSVGTKSITIDIGGPVAGAALYWVGRDFPCAQDGSGNCTLAGLDQDLVFDGVPISGTVTGAEVNFAALDGSIKTNNIGYKADVTSIVQAKGSGLRSFTIQDGDTPTTSGG